MKDLTQSQLSILIVHFERKTNVYFEWFLELSSVLELF